MSRHEELTQSFSTWGDKLLKHTDVLFNIQRHRKFKPITIQLAPCEVCESDCAFCSVSERPLKSVMPWTSVMKVIDSFVKLGAKSLEITGGGNPMLYRSGDYDINDIVAYASKYLDIGIITNSHDFKKLRKLNHDKINWIRVSLIKLDEGVDPESYNFRGFPEEKIGFSYIIYDGVEETPRTKVSRVGTTRETIKKLARMVELHPDVKFVRIAGNCLIKGNNEEVRKKWRPIIDEIDENGKFFVKDIGSNDDAFNDGCYVGMVRPYVAPSPDGEGYFVYICTSHVLNTRTYDKKYALCDISHIEQAWQYMNSRFKRLGHPYQVSGNAGKCWGETCRFCYYSNNNRLLHAVAEEGVDRNFA